MSTERRGQRAGRDALGDGAQTLRYGLLVHPDLGRADALRAVEFGLERLASSCDLAPAVPAPEGVRPSARGGLGVIVFDWTVEESSSFARLQRGRMGTDRIVPRLPADPVSVGDVPTCAQASSDRECRSIAVADDPHAAISLGHGW